MKRLVLTGIGLVLMAGLAFAAGGAQGGRSGTGAAPAQKLTAAQLETLNGSLYYWSGFTGDSQKWDQWRVGEFSKKYPNVKVDMQSVPESAGVGNGKLTSTIAAGNPPDVIVADDYVLAYGLAGQGAFEPWDPYLEAIGLKVEDFLPGFHNLMQYQGKTYLLPQDSNIYMLFINTDMADAAGLDYKNNPPKTMEDLERWADAMTKKDARDNITTYGFIPWVDRGNDDPTFWPYMFGAEIYNTSNNKLELLDPKVIAAYEWLRTYSRKFDPEIANGFTKSSGGFFSPDHPFFQGKLAMTVSGNWTTKPLRDYAPDIKYVCVPVPAPAGGRYGGTTLGSNVFAIPKGAKRPDLAALFFKFTQDAAINADNFDQWRSIPCTDALFNDVSWTKKGDPVYLLERQIANSPLSGHPALCAVSTELAKQLATVRDEIIYNKTEPRGLLQSVMTRLQPELDRSVR
ncbi:MAG: extracellular solute-binding protein [Treponema sp.]|jgi:ABC-type glycerol-3-phosphate transport system substrate-binding protein|nr:extracellular solute-binding protein [Treponema sp.]